ncbi:VOC family protein [Jatrophihabitans fulvus]
MAVGKLWSVTLDCTEPKPLAQFWASMLDGTIAYESDGFVAVETPGGTWIGAYRIDDYMPPQWPDVAAGAPGKQFHLDLSVDDLDAASAAAQELGATVAEHQANPEGFRVLLDPAGHPFCLTTASV